MLRIRRRRIILPLFCFFVSFLNASHNTSKYFPFLEKPEEYVTYKKSHLQASLFITTASTAFNRGGGNLGIPELWGEYNLANVIAGLAALKESQGVADYNPFVDEVGYSDWNEKKIMFRESGKVKSRGIMLHAVQDLFKTGFSVGCSIPFMVVNSSIRFAFDSGNSEVGSVTTEEVDMLNRVRRTVQNDLGLKGDDWDETGIGDLDFYVQWNKYLDHKFKMKSIDINLRVGALIPVGKKRDENYPSSVPFMGNGHWGAYADLACEFELKQNWKTGFIFGVMDEFKDTEVRRIPYHGEPVIFSSLIGNVEINPGVTLKFTPYFTLENVKDGLNFQFRYTYRKHFDDTWTDKRCDQSVTSYLDPSKCPCGRIARNRMASWTSHYLTGQLVYDSAEAMKKWWLKPKFYALLDYALTGRGVSKAHQFTVGIQLHPW